jgi:hypothetical protein
MACNAKFGGKFKDWGIKGKEIAVAYFPTDFSLKFKKVGFEKVACRFYIYSTSLLLLPLHLHLYLCPSVGRTMSECPSDDWTKSGQKVDKKWTKSGQDAVGLTKLMRCGSVSEYKYKF